MRLASVAVALALLVAAASGAAGAGAPDPDESEDFSKTDIHVSKVDTDTYRTDGGVSAAQGTTTTAGGNNSTVHHRNPGRVGEGSNASDVESWLQDRMVERLVRSIDVSEEDSERARRLVGNDSKFEEFADKYAELQGESPGENRSLEDLDGVGEIQGAFLADVNEYRTTLERYRSARENGSTLRERRLAHELERRLADVNRSSAMLERGYADVSTGREDGTANATQKIEAIRSDVLATQRTVRNQTLVRTRLSVRAVAADGSFTDRVALRGRLTTADGSPVASRNVTLQVENRTVETRTNGTGHFAVTYRPTLSSVGDRERSVRFRPANTSRYLHANETVRFGVERIDPEVRITASNRSVGFGDSLTVNGTVAAENVSTGGVPVVVTLGGFPVGETTTGPNGSFGLTTTVPANLSTGERRVRARLADPDFRTAEATVSVTVEPTGTDLSMTEVRRVNGSLLVGGRLTTDGGTPLPNRTLQLAVNGTAVGTVTTNATGAYAEVVPVPSSVGRSVGVRATYSPVGENLNASNATGSVTFEASDRGLFDHPLALRMAGLFGVALIGVVLARRLGGTDWGLGGDSAPATTESDLSATVPADTGQPADALREAATERLADGEHDAAALLAYAAIRKRLDGAAGGSPAETHWEFLADCREAELREDRLAALERATEAYERAAFAAGRVPESEAAGAVEAARTVAPGEEAVDAPASEN